MTAREIADKAVAILNNKKGEQIKLIRIDDISSLADYFVFATGTSNTHVNALADELEFQLKELGVTPRHVEGYRANSWVLLDYSEVVVHIFTEESRAFYDLDKMWQDGEEIPLTL